MGEPLLKVSALNKSFGGVRAVDDFHMKLEAGSFTGLIGPNGAGKTTVLNLLSGTARPSSGSIELNGKELRDSRPEVFAAQGIARTFQNIRLFKQLSVLDNVLASLHSHSDRNLWSCLVRTASFRKRELSIHEKAWELLHTFGLEQHADEAAVHLSYGDQRKLEIVRALATSPKLQLLDEPAAGMNRAEGQQLVRLLVELRGKSELAFVLIEHDMDIIMALCDTIHVLDYGRKIFDGSPSEVRSSQTVREAYLGVEE
ncbi:Lipopolysaccharide export system ATP-binding protein LptB [compost metagenome]